jgi:hypothetical protein
MRSTISWSGSVAIGSVTARHVSFPAELSIAIMPPSASTRQTIESRFEATLREDRRMDPARDLHKAFEDRVHIVRHPGEVRLERVLRRQRGLHSAQLQAQ